MFNVYFTNTEIHLTVKWTQNAKMGQYVRVKIFYIVGYELLIHNRIIVTFI